MHCVLRYNQYLSLYFLHFSFPKLPCSLSLSPFPSLFFFILFFRFPSYLFSSFCFFFSLILFFTFGYCDLLFFFFLPSLYYLTLMLFCFSSLSFPQILPPTHLSISLSICLSICLNDYLVVGLSVVWPICICLF